MRIDAAGERLHVVPLVRPLVPVLEHDEGDAGVLAASAEAESADLEDRGDNVLLFVEQIVAQRGERLVRADAGGARGRSHVDHHDTLILVGQEPGRDPGEQQGQRRDDDAVDQQVAAALSEHPLHARRVAAGAGVEDAVEPPEEAAFLLVVAFLDGFQERRAQRGREDQRDDHRQRHRRGDGDRELPVDDAGRPAEEGHRQEHRGQHHRDADQRAGDLGHRLARGLLRRQPFLGHHALHVFDDDDGVVHQQADRQHHAEHGQRVDREAGERRAPRRSRAARPARRSSG